MDAQRLSSRPGLDSPPVTGDLMAPPAVKEILVRACYDCHSNRTNLAWFDRRLKNGAAGGQEKDGSTDGEHANGPSEATSAATVKPTANGIAYTDQTKTGR